QRSEQRLAHFTTVPFSISVQRIVEGFYLIDFYEIKQLLPAVFEVLTDHGFDVFAHRHQCFVDQIKHQRLAATATRRGSGSADNIGHVPAFTTFHGPTD